MTEFDRQLGNLVTLGYPALAGLSAAAFTARLEPLRQLAGDEPVLLVVTRALVPVEEAMARTTLAGRSKPGFVDRTFEPGALERFGPAKGIHLPAGDAYLVTGVERGEEFCGAVPAQALATIEERGRTPLTIEEGVALITHHPELLVKNKCFSLGGSRCGDRRVPAIWISQNAPKLGWCWEGNPHTWLGMASAGGRL